MSFSLILYGCNDNTDKIKDVDKVNNIPLISESTRKELHSIQNKKIIFAHHSVGKNILDGFSELTTEAGIEIEVISINNKTSMNKLKFVDFNPGKNTQPKTKIDGFANKIQNLNPDYVPDIAFMKFCYIDINPDTDVNEMFNYYRDMMAKLKKENPAITFAHLTVPLVAKSNTIKTKIKRLFGFQVWQEASNIKRHEFNSLINQSFREEPVFDIARIESTRKDGSREQFKKGGKVYYRMSPEYTTDGGHLNKLGKRIVAIEMVSFLDKTIKEKNITIK